MSNLQIFVKIFAFLLLGHDCTRNIVSDLSGTSAARLIHLSIFDMNSVKVKQDLKGEFQARSLSFCLI